jgi:hypothetical protein
VGATGIEEEKKKKTVDNANVVKQQRMNGVQSKI